MSDVARQWIEWGVRYTGTRHDGSHIIGHGTDRAEATSIAENSPAGETGYTTQLMCRTVTVTEWEAAE